MKGDKLHRQDGSGSQKRNHEGRQACETRRQRQPKEKIMKGDKLGKQGGGNQFPQSGTHPLRSKNPDSFAIWGTIQGVQLYDVPIKPVSPPMTNDFVHYQSLSLFRDFPPMDFPYRNLTRRHLVAVSMPKG